MSCSFILTDDQAIAMDPAGLPLGDMQPMKRTRQLLMDEGLHMENCAWAQSLCSATAHSSNGLTPVYALAASTPTRTSHL
jgi:hypothetical protein